MEINALRSVILNTLEQTNWTKMDIKGVPMSSTKCPISNYVRAIGDIAGYTLEVLTSNMTMYIYDELTGKHMVDISLPTEARKFVRRFDNGEYPELELNHANYLKYRSEFLLTV